MTGRAVFSKLAPLLYTMVAALKLLPHGLVTRMWWMVEWLPGKFGIGIRYVFAKRLCKDCGANVLIGPGVFVDHWHNLSFGENVTLHRNCYVDARGGIEIGDNVSIAHATSLLAFDHSWDNAELPIKYNELICYPIHIDDDVWLGCGVRVLAGATITSRTVVAANAVVTRGEIGGGIYGGVPANLIRELEPSDLIAESVSV